jgi:hypothetical protein
VIDPTECWPSAWRKEFSMQNRDLEPDEQLQPEEFLRCRFMDIEGYEDEAETIRSQRHHEVFLKVLEVQAAYECQAEAMYSNADACVDTARHWADLAYPKPEVKP